MASQKNSYREKIRETNPFDPPQENVRPAPPKTPNFVGAVEITKPSGKVTSAGGGNFPSKYPQLLASIGSVVNDFHKTFTEKESYAAVDVSHVITNNNAVGNFCTYLIDGSSDSISADTNWRSFTIKQEMIEALKVGDPPSATPEEPSKETPEPVTVVADPAPKASPPTNTTTTTPRTRPRGIRGMIGRGRSSSTSTTPRYAPQRGGGGGRSSGGGGSRNNTILSENGPLGRGNYEFEIRNQGSDNYIFRNNNWNRL